MVLLETDHILNPLRSFAPQLYVYECDIDGPPDRLLPVGFTAEPLADVILSPLEAGFTCKSRPRPNIDIDTFIASLEIYRY